MIVHMIGNAHIDPVWLWRWQSGADEACATCRSAVKCCREFPDFIFTRGEAWLYQQIELLDPKLFAEVRQLVEKGQWHITGGQHVQPDTNIPTGVGWRRQIEHGQRYFQNRFGVHPRVGYNVDAFGHTAAIPDLYTAFGYVGYVFGRPDEQQVPSLPQTFRWCGVQGGELLTFRLPGTAYNTRVDDLYIAIMRSVEQADPALGHTMCFYGVGNHGGGPTKANIEYIQSHIHAFPGLELRFSTPQSFFDAIAHHGESLPVVTKELQHTFPGCYSVMHPIKQGQRHSEARLAQAEQVLNAFSTDLSQKHMLAKRIDAAWDDLLFTQFHDILSGTSIPSAWSDVQALQGRATLAADEVIMIATRQWAQQTSKPQSEQRILALNPTIHEWNGWIETEPSLDFDVWGNRWLSDIHGLPIAYQRIQAESPQMIQRVLFPLHIPAQSSTTVLLQQHTPKPPTREQTDLAVSPYHLSNKRLQLDLTTTGIKNLSLDGTPLLSSKGIELFLREDHTDTWTFTTDLFSETISEYFTGDGWIVEEGGPLRARVRQEGWLGHSRVRWTVTLYREEARFEMDLEILFAEHFKLLQLLLSLVEPAEQWLSGLAQGQIERATSMVEYPLQGWSRISLPDQQLAVVTPDIYSMSLNVRSWQWTLLRSPKMAWMGDGWGGGNTSLYAGRDWFTDQGMHTFHMAFHADQELLPETLEQATWQQLQQPIVFDRYEGMHRAPWGSQLPFHLR